MAPVRKEARIHHTKNLIQQGNPTALIGLQTRYTHLPFETYDLDDFDGAILLVSAFVATASP